MIRSQECGFQYAGSEMYALQNVNLSITPGECVVLCGQSGCGKTTFTRLLNGLAPAFFTGELSGSCQTLGLRAGQAAIEDYVPLVGSVFQNPKTQYFNVDTTAELAFPCENSGIPPQEIQKRVQSCAQKFGLEGLLGRSIFKLSGGEKQRIAFATACMLAPKLLVLDEPTSNLDASVIDALHDMIAQMKTEGVTIVIAEHRLAWLADLADRYILFEAGQVTQQWTAKEFASLPAEQLSESGLRPRELTPYRELVKEKRESPPAGDKAALTAKELCIGYHKKYPVCTLPEFSIQHGEIVGLMGSNGAGKSTLAKTLCGLIKPLSGSISWHGHPTNAHQRMRESYFVMQDVNYQLFSDSVREEVLLGAAYPERCDTVLQALDLAELADRHPMSLSGGQKQRVAIATALLAGKSFIVLDEPTSGLDYRHMVQVGVLLQQLKAQGAAVLVITHDEELVAGWCDRVLYLEKQEENHAV